MSRLIQWKGSGRETPCSVCSNGSCGATGGWLGMVTGANVLPDGWSRRLRCSPAVLAPGLALTPATAAPADEKVTFTVAFQNEVDSFNPFVGIEASSFEAWALTYDYLIDYSMEDMSPEPGLATSWETSDDGLTWTFDIRDDVVFSDGEPLTAEDVAFTFSRILDGGPEAATWGAYLGQVTSATATDDTTLVLELEKPNSSLPLLPIPIVPEHIWKDVSEDEVKTLQGGAGGRPAGRGLRPVPAGRGPGRRLDVPLGGEPGLLEGRRPTSTRS